MSDIALTAPLAPARAETRQALLSLDAVGKRYVGSGVEHRVLQGITLDLLAGRSLALIGKSGCGKSTLLRLMAGIDSQYDGTIARRAGLAQAMVFQEHRLFPWLTALQNVVLGSALRHTDKHAAITQAVRALTLVGLAHAQLRYPHELSGGMAQRVAIARALVGEPDVLFLDEPFGALDAITRGRLQTELQTITQSRGISLVVVTHDVDEAVLLADEVLVLHPAGQGSRLHVAVDLPYPRDRKLRDFVETRNRLADGLLEPA